MSEETSAQEVHEELEQFEDFNKGWGKYLALTTAIIAVISAIASLQSGTFADKALLEKNSGVLYQSQASDKWSYYQAKGIKKNLADGLAQTSGQAHFADEAKRYGKEQEAIKMQADSLEAKVKEADSHSDELFEKHHKMAFGTTLLQIAIALSAISALIRKKSFWMLSLISMAIGIGLAVYGYLL